MTHATEQDVIAAAEELLRTLDELDAEDAQVVAAAESGRGAADVVALPELKWDDRGRKQASPRSGAAAPDKSTGAPTKGIRIVDAGPVTRILALGNAAVEASAAVVPGEDEDVVIVTIPHAAEGISKG